MPLARLNALQDPSSSPLKIDVESLKDPGGESFLFPQEPEQQRLGADMAELALTCFGLRELNSHPSPLGEPLKPRHTHLGNASRQRVHHRGADLVRRDARLPERQLEASSSIASERAPPLASLADTPTPTGDGPSSAAIRSSEPSEEDER